MQSNTIETIKEVLEKVKGTSLEPVVPINIKDNDTQSLVTVKFRTFVKVQIQEVSISPSAVESVLHANFTPISLMMKRKTLEVVCMEAILTFVKLLEDATVSHSYSPFDEWMFLSAYTGELTTAYLMRREAFIEIVRNEFLPTTTVTDDFPYDEFGISISFRKKNKLLKIFSKVLLKEVLRSVSYSKAG